MDSLKGLLRSKVFYFNAITIGLELANLLAPVLPQGSLTLINAVGNLALRFVTTESLADKVRYTSPGKVVEIVDSVGPKKE